MGLLAAVYCGGYDPGGLSKAGDLLLEPLVGGASVPDAPVDREAELHEVCSSRMVEEDERHRSGPVYTGEERARGGGSGGRNLLGRPPGEVRKGVATSPPLVVVAGERNGCTECYLLFHRSVHRAAEFESHSPPGSRIPVLGDYHGGRSLERGRWMQACDLRVGRDCGSLWCVAKVFLCPREASMQVSWVSQGAKSRAAVFANLSHNIFSY